MPKRLDADGWSPGVGARVAAVRDMGRSRDPRHASAVAEALRAQDHPRVRKEAASALGSIGGEVALAALLEVEPPTSSVRRAMSRSLGVLGDARAVPMLVELLDHPVPREGAARALGRIGDAAAVPGLAAMAVAGPRLSRSVARAALVETGLPEAVDALRERPRSNPVSRRRELAAAQRAVTRRRAREAGEPPGSADRLAVRQRLGAIRAVLICVLIVIGSDALAGADRGRLAGAAAVTSVVIGWLLFFQRDAYQANVDLVRRRARSDLRLRQWRSPARTALALLPYRPVSTLRWLAVPVGAEWLLGGPGLLAGVAVGLCVAAAVDRAAFARAVARVERERGEVLLIDGSAAPDHAGRRRAFLAGGAVGA